VQIEVPKRAGVILSQSTAICPPADEVLENDLLPISAACARCIVTGFAEGETGFHGMEGRCFDDEQLR
jgi:hypothetical protein